jgi:hypothetical protein
MGTVVTVGLVVMMVVAVGIKLVLRGGLVVMEVKVVMG